MFKLLSLICTIMICSSSIKAFRCSLSRIGNRRGAFLVNNLKSAGSLQLHSVSTTSLIDATERMRIEAEAEMDKICELYSNTSNNNNIHLWRSGQESATFMQNIDTVLFDCDGVLYRAPDQAPGARNCIQSLLQNNKQVYFVTNNAGQNRLELKDKLSKILQIKQGLTEEMMISSSYSCAQYLKKHILDKKEGSSASLYVVGSSGLCTELRETGFHVTGGPSSETDKPSMTRDELASYDFSQHHQPIDAVVVGHDIDFNFRKMCIANVLLQMNPTAPLVATNEDAFDLVGVDARQIPGNGCVVRALEYSSKRKAINVGKPSKSLADLIFATSENFDPKRCLMVGDRLDTDIRFGVDFGMHSALVLTGVTGADKLRDLGEGTEEEPLPSIILPHLGYLAAP